MPPRAFTNPPPLTESARTARAAFYCDLCSKGYSRQNEYDSHLSSYEHNHKTRLKDLKAMNQSMAAQSRGKAEDKGNGLIKIQPIGLGGKKEEGKGGFKKGGFKSAFGKAEEPAVVVKVEEKEGDEIRTAGQVRSAERILSQVEESDTEDEGYECYDPRMPTGCTSACKGRT